MQYRRLLYTFSIKRCQRCSMFDTIYKDVVYDKLRSSVLLEFRHNLLATEIEISVSLMDNRITSDLSQQIHWNQLIQPQ